MPRDGLRRELVKGVLVEMSSGGFDHSVVAINLVLTLGPYVKSRNLGKIVGMNAGFRLERDPDTVRAPDVAFIRKDRLPTGPDRTRFPLLAPDLVAEVVSPSDRREDIEAQAIEYLDAGVRLVWVVQPATQTVTEYRSRRQIRVLTAADPLDGHDVVPGFRAIVRALFE
jgi:Uma2 family endonuclease